MAALINHDSFVQLIDGNAKKRLNAAEISTKSSLLQILQRSFNRDLKNYRSLRHLSFNFVIHVIL